MVLLTLLVIKYLFCGRLWILLLSLWQKWYIILLVQYLSDMTSHKLQQNQTQLFSSNWSVLYNKSLKWLEWWKWLKSMLIFPPITTHVKKAMHGCMHVFSYDARTNGWKLFTLYQKLWIHTCNINLEAVQYIIEREFTTNLNYFIRIYKKNIK